MCQRWQHTLMLRRMMLGQRMERDSRGDGAVHGSEVLQQPRVLRRRLEPRQRAGQAPAGVGVAGRAVGAQLRSGSQHQALRSYTLYGIAQSIALQVVATSACVLRRLCFRFDLLSDSSLAYTHIHGDPASNPRP